ncbi:copper resistance system multicopper oxidase [Caulobacter segnis]|uniref:copper resistance system multicopper oxidase n=1 Tax=Caulobacter segnis TaxID=88688 RepID=UPI001CBE7800|nr:copper resistance system multicopper oxidase [Caulobacter segnis]UAL11642.1 copper resistance system multicopper oxidase [Caulobacter segnis]
MMTAFDRRTLLRGALGLGAVGLLPAWARAGEVGRSPAALSGEEIKLTVGHQMATIDGRSGHAVTVNGSLPGPLIRLKEGQNVRIAVTNALADEDTSIHWHGLLVPFQMDGVPGVAFPGIKPGETFTYDFPVRQAGTYWWHSHSGLQEQVGLYAPMIIDPAGEDPIGYDREHVVVLSDWSFLHPHALFRKLKVNPGHFNMQKQTFAGLLAGQDQSLKDRVAWGKMRMDPTDIADVTGSVYTYLVNGHGPGDNWTGLFASGERVRLRFINAAAMTIFNVRIPGLSLEVVAVDGQPVSPVSVDEFQMAPAETFDVIVRPTEDQAFTLVAEASDRSGLARGTLAPRLGMSAPIPPVRKRPLATMKDMGMGNMHGGMDMPGMDMSMRSQSNAPDVPLTPGVQTIAPMPMDRMAEPPQGLEDVGHKVLTYAQLANLHESTDKRPPGRTIEIHLTGNMERFMWAFDGEAFGPIKKPIAFRRDERVRVVLINDTMMAHPIHLHGHFFELVNGQERQPLKHTVNVAPGGKVAFDLTASEPGDWAFHCHLLLHMHAGMFNVVTVRPLDGEAA